MRTERSVVAAGSLRLAVERVARPGPVRGAMLCVNGAVATMAALRWAVEGLTDFDLLLFDFPPFGASAGLNRHTPFLDKDAQADLILALIDAFRPDYLLAQSWGGTAALLALATRPPCVKGAIVSAYSAGLSPAMRRLAEALGRSLAAGDRAAAARLTVETLGERLPPLLQRLQERYFLRFSDDEARHVAWLIAHAASLSFDELAPSMAAIGVPVLIANGAEDRFTSPAAAAPLLDWLPQARQAVVPDAGHFLAMEGPGPSAACIAGIRAFLQPSGPAPSADLAQRPFAQSQRARV